MVDRDLVCDYIIGRVAAAGETLNLLKLQKLMYYVQAWHLAFYGTALFPGRFQAWVHGPVNRELYDRFASSKSLYSTIGPSDVLATYNSALLDHDVRGHIDTVLEAYAKFTGTQLEEMTHKEKPWIEARGGCDDSQRCEREINEVTMQQFYAARLN